MQCDNDCENCSEQNSCSKPEKTCTSDKCKTCPSKDNCGSKAPDATEQNVRIAETILKFSTIFVVMSGKGGVGKSTIATQLAYYLAARCNKQVAVVDLDICGPSMPTMTGTKHEEVIGAEGGMIPVRVSDNLQLISVGHMTKDENDPVIMRGVKKHSLIASLLGEVNWNLQEENQKNNIMIIDTPPGTSDEHLSTINILKQCSMLIPTAVPKPQLKAIIITTPQEVALADIRKQLDFCSKIQLQVKGVIENMAGFTCPGCQNVTQIFKPAVKNIQMLCEQYHCQLLGSLQLDVQLVKCGETGVAWSQLIENEDEADNFLTFQDIVAKILE